MRFSLDPNTDLISGLQEVDGPRTYALYFPDQPLATSSTDLSRRLYTNNTPAAPANTPATPSTFCCAPTSAGAAAPEGILAALELALELAALALALPLLELSALALALALAPELGVTVTTLVPEPWLTVLSSVGMLALKESVIETAGGSVEEVGVLVPTMLVSACWELLSSDSVETSTVKGCVWAHVEAEDCALVRPRTENSAEFLIVARRILGNLDESESPDGLGE
ncbi:hypothetical protein E8E13_004499 [Curvularia kusanoi]|uniref:Uncharacterized protein n=1 Tax=Curvularia kusanoi TaxID=90978 RepID=A0A9P4TD95_CURKU|nr:hypothetical protein E8E13_004499 [Curvularia kusanoi]